MEPDLHTWHMLSPVKDWSCEPLGVLTVGVLGTAWDQRTSSGLDVIAIFGQICAIIYIRSSNAKGVSCGFYKGQG